MIEIQEYYEGISLLSILIMILHDMYFHWKKYVAVHTSTFFVHHNSGHAWPLMSVLMKSYKYIFFVHLDFGFLSFQNLNYDILR